MTSFREEATKILTAKENEIFHGSFDTVGNIAILDIEPGLVKKEKKLGELLMKMQSNIKTVCKKAGIHSGKFRTQKLKIIAGKRTKETVHVENGVKLKVHVDKIYFTPRLATDRQWIAEQVKAGERVLVMFSGVGPYGLVIAKKQPNCEVHQVELNKTGHDYCAQNIILNKMQNRVFAYNGDVRKVVPKLGVFDRILMPLPKDSEDFLDTAFLASKKGTIIHLYTFGNENEIEKVKSEFIGRCLEKGKKISVLGITKCGAYKPRVFRLRVDFVVK